MKSFRINYRAFFWLFVLTFRLFAGEPGDIQSYTIHPASVEIQCTQAKIRITAYLENAFRFDVIPENVNFNPLPVPELADSLPQFTFQIHETPDTLTVSSSRYRIQFQKFPFSFSVQNNSGEFLLELDNNGLQWNSDRSQIRFQLQANDHFYGFGEKGIDLDRRGHAFGMRNRAIFGYNAPLPEMNINIPFFLSLQGYGMYFHVSYPGYFDLGDSAATKWYYRSGGEPWMQFFVFVGDNPKTLIRSYTGLTGRMPLPPAWALGFLQSKYGYQSETEARQVVNTFRQKGIPLDALILDLYWFSNMGDFQWDYASFPNPTQMISDFLNTGVRTVLITEPYIRDNSINYNTASSNGYLGQTATGQTYLLPNFWYGPAALVDFTNPQAQAWWESLYQPLINQGVGGWWTDLGEPELHPDDMVHHWGDAPRVHNIMNLLWNKILFDYYEQNTTRRLFNLTRSGYAGMQRYGAIPWSGDVERSFSGLAVQPVLMQSMALSGVPFHNSDIGGFAGPPTSPELYARWMQYGVFCPLTRPHSAFQDVEPWSFGSQVEQIATRYIKLRLSLFPYNYSYLYRAHQTGISIVRPLILEYPEDPQVRNMGDQYLWGEAFLIAPVLSAGATERNVYLPEGQWIDYHTETVYQGNQWLTAAAPLTRLPIFVKAGSIIPRTIPGNYVLQDSLDTLIVEVYPSAQDSFLLYEDDGISRDYQNGAYELTVLKYSVTDDQLTLFANPSGGGFTGQPAQRTYLYAVHLVNEAPDSVYWNGQLAGQSPDSLTLIAAGHGWVYQAFNHRLLILGRLPTSQALLVEVFGFSGSSHLPGKVKIPEGFRLWQNYPNPFNSSTRIRYYLSAKSKVTLRVFNLLGQEVTILVDGFQEPGFHSAEWEGKNRWGRQMSSGIYIFRLTVDGASGSRKMVMLR